MVPNVVGSSPINRPKAPWIVLGRKRLLHRRQGVPLKGPFLAPFSQGNFGKVNEIVLFSRFCIFCNFSLLRLGYFYFVWHFNPLRLAIGVCFALLLQFIRWNNAMETHSKRARNRPPYVVHAIRKEGHSCLEACFRSKGKRLMPKLLTVRGSDFQSLKGPPYPMHGSRE